MAEAGRSRKAISKPIGRPSSYKVAYCNEIIEAMTTGLSAEAAAAKIGISARSLYNWQHEHPEFLQAVQEGRQRALLWWEERALAMAEGKPGNAQLIILGLKNRSRAASGWIDQQRTELSGADGGPIQVQPAKIDARALSHEQRDQLRAILMVAIKEAPQKV